MIVMSLLNLRVKVLCESLLQKKDAVFIARVDGAMKLLNSRNSEEVNA
jgi:hypothetical protein